MLLEQQARHQQERERLQQKFDLRIKDMVRQGLTHMGHYVVSWTLH